MTIDETMYRPGDAGDGPTPPRRRTAKRIVIAVLLAVTVGMTSIAGYAYWALGGTTEGKPVRIIVAEGANASQIADQLARAGVVRSALAFRLVARTRGLAAALKPGAYDLRVGLGVDAALDKLKDGIPVKVFRFTIPEGKTLREMAAIVEDRTPISGTAFTRAATEAPRPKWVPPNVVPEGLLYPDTYLVDEDMDAEAVVTRLHQEFLEVAEAVNLERRARALGVTPYEALIIASLIEREAEGDIDREKISSVIYNRLEIGMRLQIDATVQYAIAQDTGTYKGERLTTRDNQTYDSPYNTYRIEGLPPTPIAAPGRASLEAALNPETTQFLYYRVSRSTGRHCFSRTLAEHNRCAA